MASSRNLPTNPTYNTYNSAGGADYDDLFDWDADTDVDLVATTTSYILKVEAGAHDDNIVIGGAVANATYYRVLMADTGAGHNGVPLTDGSIAALTSTIDAGFLVSLFEDYCQVQDLVIKFTLNSANSRPMFQIYNNQTKVIGCMAVDGQNAGAGVISQGYKTHAGVGEKQFVINCLAHNIDGSYGFLANTDGVSYFYNCTATNNNTNFKDAKNTSVAKNCLAVGHTVLDWDGVWTKTTCSAEDATANFRDSANDDFRLAYNDTTAKDQGTDLSADGDFAFDDDICDGVMGAGKAGQTRGTDGQTWDIGFDEYMLDHSVDIVGTPYKVNDVHAEDIRSFSGAAN